MAAILTHAAMILGKHDPFVVHGNQAPTQPMSDGILVTGSAGLVGRVLRRRLTDLSLTHTDRPQVDVCDRDGLSRAMSGHAQVVHLAVPPHARWTRESVAVSLTMVRNVLAAARAAGVKRVLIPSSVRATATIQLLSRRRVGVDETILPETRYGRTRLEIEALAREACESGLEAVCIRLGTVSHPDAPSHHARWRPYWISHEDCAGAFRACLTSPVVPGRFSVFYAVSDLPERVFDTANPFGWMPQTRTVGVRRAIAWRVHIASCAVRGRLRIGTRLKTLATMARRWTSWPIDPGP